MERPLSRPGGWRLHYILIVGFVLTTAITIIVGAWLTYNLINNYLAAAGDARVGRDMDLALAFYDLKLKDISSSARRLAGIRTMQDNIEAATEGQSTAIQLIEQEIRNEVANLPYGTRRFFLVTDASGKAISGEVASDGQIRSIVAGTDWSRLPIVGSMLTRQQALSATEVLPVEMLNWIGLSEQAQIPLIDTPKAAPKPFDPREGTAGLVLFGAAPVFSQNAELAGAVLVGHMFNGDFTLVDRIKQVAGVDTATIFFGDLRVSTNVLDEAGKRAIGTRVSQEVFDKVLVDGEEFTGPAYVVNQWYITRYRSLYDHHGNIVGILYVGAKQAAFQQLVESFRHQVYLIAAATIVLAILIAVPVAWSLSRPLTRLAEATRSVAEGDWSVRMPVRGYQEMRILSGAFNTMVSALEDTRQQLVQKEKLASVGQLAAGVAHEINNPLGSILLYADILRKETPEDNQQQRQDLELIIRETTRCKTIVNDLLNFSRQNEVLAQETDVNAMLQDLAEESRQRHLFRSVEVVTDLAPALGTIQADPLQLHQVFINLMNNAAEAMPEGGKLTLRTHAGPGPDLITVEVEDTGIGISPENMNKLFTPFFTTKAIGRGTGLGLAIIYGIVKMHRGQIGVKSELGKGTTFTILLRKQLPVENRQSANSVVLK